MEEHNSNKQAQKLEEQQKKEEQSDTLQKSIKHQESFDAFQASALGKVQQKNSQNNKEIKQQSSKQSEKKDANLQKLSSNFNLNNWEVIDSNLNTKNPPPGLVKFPTTSSTFSSSSLSQSLNSSVSGGGNNFGQSLFSSPPQPPTQTLNSPMSGGNSSFGSTAFNFSVQSKKLNSQVPVVNNSFSFENPNASSNNQNNSINQNNSNSFPFGSSSFGSIQNNANSINNYNTNPNLNQPIGQPIGFKIQSEPHSNKTNISPFTFGHPANINTSSSQSQSFSFGGFGSVPAKQNTSFFGSFNPPSTIPGNSSFFSSPPLPPNFFPQKIQPFGFGTQINTYNQANNSKQYQQQFMDTNTTPQKNKIKVQHIVKSINTNNNFSLNIKQLKLSNCGIQDHHLKQMVQGIKWTSLQKLYLSLNKISDISCLTEQNVPNIMWLTLMYNPLNNKSCIFLCDRKWKKLQKLSISFAKENRRFNQVYFFQNFQKNFQALNTLWTTVSPDFSFKDFQRIDEIMKKRQGDVYYYTHNGWLQKQNAFNKIEKQEETLKYNNLSKNSKLMLKLYAASLGKSFDPDEDKKNIGIWKEFQIKQSAPNDSQFSPLKQQQKNNLLQQNIEDAEVTFTKTIQKFQKFIKISQELQVLGPSLIANSQIQKAFQCYTTVVNIIKKVINEKQEFYRQKIKKNPLNPLFMNNPFNQAINNQLKKIKSEFNSLDFQHYKNFGDNFEEIQNLIKHLQEQPKYNTVPSELQVQKIISAVVYQQKYILARQLKSLAKTFQMKKMQKKAYQTYCECNIIYQDLMKTSFQLLISTKHHNAGGFGFGFGMQSTLHTTKTQSWIPVHDNFNYSQNQYILTLKHMKNLLKNSKQEIVAQRQKQIQNICKKLNQYE